MLRRSNHERIRVSPSPQGHVCILIRHSNHSYIEISTVFSKKLQFSILNNQDTVKVSEFEVTHRDLYTAADRLPVKNGVLDRRLVRRVL
jgi:hypothetical protein